MTPVVGRPGPRNRLPRVPGRLRHSRLDAAGAPLADYVIAIDTVGAGGGERVLVLDEGNGARQVFASKDAPVRSVIVGIVDDVANDGLRPPGS